MQSNCEIKISFLEIYKENVTDLLEGHTSHRRMASPKSGAANCGGAQKEGFGKSMRDRSSSFIIHQKQPGQEDRGQNKTNLRGKSRTFYLEQDKLEDIVSKKRQQDAAASGASPNKSVLIDANQTGRKSTALARYNNSALRDGAKLQYKVKENAIKGVYVDNLSEVICSTAE